MIALFCGSRSWATRDDRDWVRESVRSELRTLDPSMDSVMHGAAPGADSIADWEAMLAGFQTDPFPADWERLEMAAGPERNGRMRDALVHARMAGIPVAVFALHHGPGLGTGTADMVEKAARSGITSKLILASPPEPDEEVSALVLHDGDGRFLLQHRDDFAPSFPGMHGLFGGHLESGESPEDALRREAAEELGLELSDPIPIGSHLFRLPDRTMLVHAWMEHSPAGADALRGQQGEGQGLGFFSTSEADVMDVPGQDRYVLRAASSRLRGR